MNTNSEMIRLSDIVHEQSAEIARLRAELAVRDRAIEALFAFARTVAPSSSWWDEVWPEHEAALAKVE